MMSSNRGNSYPSPSLPCSFPSSPSLDRISLPYSSKCNHRLRQPVPSTTRTSSHPTFSFIITITILLLILHITCIDSFTTSEFSVNHHHRNCSRCVLHGEARARRLEEVKADILHKLGLKEAPNVTLKELPNIPPLHNFLGRFPGIDPEDLDSSSSSNVQQVGGGTDDERMSSDMPANSAFSERKSSSLADYEDYEEFFMNTEKSISLARNPPKSLNIPKELKTQYFKFSPKVLNSHLSRAHLWIHVKPNSSRSLESASESQSQPEDSNRKKTAWIVIYQVVRSSEEGSMKNTPTLLHIRAQKVHISPSDPTWVRVNVKRLVSRWFDKPSENLGLVIHSYDEEGRELLIGRPNEVNEEEGLQIPFIEVKVETYSHSRKRRMIGLNCEESSEEVRCCRYPLTVDFEEFGWDWIIAPKRYEANYCSGECPFVFLQKYPHTHLVQQASPAGATGPCCAPRKMSAISMLYFDDNYNIVYGMLPGMVVDRCGCA